jgi:hypothetical protein
VTLHFDQLMVIGLCMLPGAFIVGFLLAAGPATAATSSASPGARAVSSPASRTDPRDPRDIAMAIAREMLAPPPLAGLGADVMLAVAAVPGKILEEWRHAAYGVWIAWPHAADAIHAEEMTAAQLRAILAARDAR